MTLGVQLSLWGTVTTNCLNLPRTEGFPRMWDLGD